MANLGDKIVSLTRDELVEIELALEDRLDDIKTSELVDIEMSARIHDIESALAKVRP